MNAIEDAWTQGGALAQVLRPAGMLYRTIMAVRAFAYGVGWRTVNPSPLPVVVVGNLTVGGTGKTPLTAKLVAEFRARGWTPGIVSRGYGGERHETPRHVGLEDVSASVGDEPLMLRRITDAPVCVCVHRAQAVAALARDTDCDLIIADDGLQHLAMARDIEIVVVDEEYGLGNGRLLPAGPLREVPARLYGVDLLAVRCDSRRDPRRDPSHDVDCIRSAAPTAPLLAASDQTVRHIPGLVHLESSRLPPAMHFHYARPTLRQWPSGERQALSTFAGRKVHAVAGIGHPERFFDMLRDENLTIEAHALPDHHALSASDLDFADDHAVLVTEKDAARLAGVAPLPDQLYVVAIEVALTARAAEPLDTINRVLQARHAELGLAKDYGDVSPA